MSKKGGFSDAVYNSRAFQDYIKNPTVAGYIGSSSRTPYIDKYVERKLRSLGMGPNAIAIWLTSTSGRHMMDDVSPKDKVGKLGLKMNESLKSAPLEVVVWTDPEHDGTLGSSHKLREKYKNKDILEICLKRLG
jgi:hypothetical protein